MLQDKDQTSYDCGLGGGMGRSESWVAAHLSPSSISMTGISSTIGYFRLQSWQINQLSLYSFSIPSFSCTHAGHRNISKRSLLTICSPFKKQLNTDFTTCKKWVVNPLFLWEFPQCRVHIRTLLARVDSGL